MGRPFATVAAATAKFRTVAAATDKFGTVAAATAKFRRMSTSRQKKPRGEWRRVHLEEVSLATA